jgi:HEAT repeat protein
MIDENPAKDATFLYALARDGETRDLVMYLKQSDKAVIRRRCAEILGDLSDGSAHDDEVAVRGLIDAVLKDEDDSVRARAIDALYRYGDDALHRLINRITDVDVEDVEQWSPREVLTAWLDAEYPEFRLVAARALGDSGDERAVTRLVDALTDPAPRVRAQVARSCGQIGDPRCVDPLADRLGDPNVIVQRAAANALGAIGTTEALEPLVPVTQADDTELRRIAIEELGQYGTLDPIVVLIRCLDDDPESVRRAAMLSLFQLFVNSSSDQEETIRATVVDQLERIDTEAVVPLVRDIMEESQRWRIRRNAAWLLGAITDPDSDYRDTVYDCLLAALDDEDQRTAQLAAASLADLPSRELQKRLQMYVHDDDNEDAAVERAEYVLQEIGAATDSELVTNSIDYTYVRDPADYTEHRRTDNGD